MRQFVNIISYIIKEKKNLFLFGNVAVLQKKQNKKNKTKNRESKTKGTLILLLRKIIIICCVLSFLPELLTTFLQVILNSKNEHETWKIHYQLINSFPNESKLLQISSAFF